MSANHLITGDGTTGVLKLMITGDADQLDFAIQRAAADGDRYSLLKGSDVHAVVSDPGSYTLGAPGSGNGQSDVNPV